MAAHLTVILPLHKRAHHALKFSITVCTRVLGKTIDNVSFLAVSIILSGSIELPRREKLCPATKVSAISSNRVLPFCYDTTVMVESQELCQQLVFRGLWASLTNTS